MHASLAVFVAALPALTSAVVVPSYSGMNVIFHDDFWGDAGTSPNTTAWNIITGDLGVNNELQTYSDSNENLQISGGGTLQLVPRRDSSATGGWTSGRIESVGSFTPEAGKTTRVEASIRMGYTSTSNHNGIWPAFWMLGNSMREGTVWPTCGELDIMEEKNAQLTGYGTAHCSSCSEPVGLQSTTAISSASTFQTWRLEWDRSSNYWATETITWSIDGVTFGTIVGATLGDEASWGVLAHSPFYILMNVAVGGDFAYVSSPNITLPSSIC